MNAIARLASIFHSKPKPEPVRYVVATRRESHEAQRAKLFKELELGVAVAQLTPEQKRAAIDRASIRLPLREKA